MTNGDRNIILRGGSVLLLLAVVVACGPPQYGTATLTWTPVEDDSVAGYHVYRAEKQDGTYRRINAALVRGPRYVDQTGVRGKTYHYRVTAVTSTGVESDASQTASKTID